MKIHSCVRQYATVCFIFSATDDGRVMIDSMCEIWSSLDNECQYCFLLWCDAIWTGR